MWSGPRNISTTLMYSFRQRSDTVVVDEPLYAHYLRHTGVEHPAREEILATMEDDANTLIQEVLLANYDSKIVFFKNMAHHLTGFDQQVLTDLTNILLTREPKAMLLSLRKNIPQPELRDTGLAEQVMLLEMMLAAGQEPIVLEAREVLLNPEGVLRELCQKLAIPFESSMLQWPAGPKPEDGVWAQHWYHNVHQSSGFAAYRPRAEALPASLEPLLAECQPLYERLRSYAISASA